jgi:hypothetical protein
MVTKTIGAIFIVLVCILVFPVGIAIIGGVFGIVVGVIGGVFGAVFGIIGAIFGAIFGFIGWIFEGLFDWHWPFGFFSCNFFTIAAMAIVVALIIKSKSPR